MLRAMRNRFMWFFPVLTALWLFGLIFPPAMDLENRQTVQLALLVWPAPFCIFVSRSWFLFGAALRGSKAIRILLGLLMLSVFGSSALSVDPAVSFGYSFAMGLGLICCAGIWSCLRWNMARALAIYGLAGTLFLAYTYLNGEQLQGRLTFGHPNYLAVIAFGVLSCCLLTKRPVVRYGLAAVNLIVILATESRSCLIASLITIGAYFALAHASKIRNRSGLISAIGLAVALLAVGVLFESEIREGVTSALFLHDKYRGVGTGFTGRFEAWGEAYQLFLSSPILGIGFRTHERFMTSLSSAHNGYLATLAETGLVGTSIALLLIGTCAWRLLQMSLRGDLLAIAGFASVIGFLFIAIFERYLINFGSATAVLMWIFMLMPRWPRHAPQRAASLPHPA
jgi:O-antigen ligase